MATKTQQQAVRKSNKKPTPAQIRARRENIRKAQKARWKNREGNRDH